MCQAEYFGERGRLAQLGEHLPYKQGVIGSSPIATTILFESGSVVEHRLAKARVASSNLVSRLEESVLRTIKTDFFFYLSFNKTGKEGLMCL